MLTFKRKTKKARDFVADLHSHLVNSPQFRQNLRTLGEVEIQRELRPIILEFLSDFFYVGDRNQARNEASKNFYWGGQEGNYDEIRSILFASRNYPDFVIKKPYKIAIEYKRGDTGALVKAGIGQSIMHTMSGEYEFSYLMFHDTSNNKKIKTGAEGLLESKIIEKMYRDYNVIVEFV